ncbi:hypothetical protein [Salinispora pacifica]|uniref:hypothetical protein n=1 Tax=Salinispora pacifica TaxID=351187 RepID=UPI00037233D9|nr:hypothetical protein [Salinispora pacifica]
MSRQHQNQDRQRFPRLHQPEQPPSLPSWMLDPPPPRRTTVDRIAAALLALPGAAALRRRWQVWQGRRRLYQRFPNTMKLAGFIVSFAVALGLVMATYALLGMASS